MYTDIGSSYIFNRSRPLRFARMNAGPTDGTIYNVANRANIENPNEVYSAGSGGTGFKNGRRMYQDATGTKPRSKTRGRLRGAGISVLILRRVLTRRA